MGLRFTILLGGALTPTPRLDEQARASRIIAADGGIVHAPLLRVQPELWVGDFDSTPPGFLERYANLPRQEYPVAKDQTDGELAIQAALERGATELLLVGALGGQTDHALAHLTLGLRLAREGVGVVLSSGLKEAHPLLPGRLRLELPPGTRFSMVPLSNLKGLSLSGAQWSLEAAHIQLGDTRTLSNQALGAIEVRLGAGYGVLMAHFAPPTTSVPP